MSDAFKEAERLLGEGDELADARDDEAALRLFQAAWAALPEPRESHDLAIQILGAIADSHFWLGRWSECVEAVQEAYRCGAAPDDPFLRLRLGQSHYELGNEREAANWLAPAYLSEGRALFDEEDPKYLAFLKGKLEPPPGGWPDGW